MLEVLLNGVRVFAGARPSLSRPQDHSFAINAKELPEMQDITVHLKVKLAFQTFACACCFAQC